MNQEIFYPHFDLDTNLSGDGEYLVGLSDECMPDIQFIIIRDLFPAQALRPAYPISESDTPKTLQGSQKKYEIIFQDFDESGNPVCTSTRIKGELGG